jgi:hypothetical protein
MKTKEQLIDEAWDNYNVKVIKRNEEREKRKLIKRLKEIEEMKT